jgi:hypothetical protein
MNIKVINKPSFKFAFEDAAITTIQADSVRDAVILVVANRIRAKKPTKPIASWSKAFGAKDWDKINQASVMISLQ